ncbi:hypothetical protein J6590_056821 [Homalodisca vitripennis]|nr:hypothetical protein J6590_056821 [Homalodisca vitripennis]
MRIGEIHWAQENYCDEDRRNSLGTRKSLWAGQEKLVGHKKPLWGGQEKLVVYKKIIVDRTGEISWPQENYCGEDERNSLCTRKSLWGGQEDFDVYKKITEKLVGHKKITVGRTRGNRCVQENHCGEGRRISMCTRKLLKLLWGGREEFVVYKKIIVGRTGEISWAQENYCVEDERNSLCTRKSLWGGQEDFDVYKKITVSRRGEFRWTH